MNYSKRAFKILISLLLYIFDSITLIFFKVFLINKKKVNNPKSSILILNTGALGDILLLINSLQNIPKENRQNFSILVDKNYSKLFENKGFNKIYSIQTKKYLSSIIYRFKFNLQLTKTKKFHLIANSRGSRNIIYEDSIIRFLNSKKKVAISSDSIANSKYLINFLDTFIYNKIYYLNKNILFHETEKSFHLFKKITNYKSYNKLNLNNLHQFIEPLVKIQKNNSKFITLNIGAGQSWKKWDVNKFIELGNYISSKTKLTAIYLGTKIDYKSINNSKIKINDKSINMCGKTNLNEYFSYINNSEFSICNDSSAIHLSILLNKKTICIKSEFASDTWYPYPEIVKKKKWKVIKHKNLKNISVNSVLEKIDDWI